MKQLMTPSVSNAPKLAIPWYEAKTMTVPNAKTFVRVVKKIALPVCFNTSPGLWSPSF